MARGRPNPGQTAVDFHPNLQIAAPDTSLTAALGPVVKLIGGLIAVVLVILSAAGAYYSLIGRIDRIDDQMRSQGESMKSLAGSIAKLANEALTAADLRAACMQMQIANQGKGWVCPFSGVPNVRPERRASIAQPEPKQQPPWSLFGPGKQ